MKKISSNDIEQGKNEAKAIGSRFPVGWGPSPFGLGAPTVPDQKEVIRKRKQKMLADSLLTPDKYFDMGIKELVGLANSGDPFAMLQLGERYWSEANILEFDPDANLTDNSQKIATRYFEQAFRGGATNIPAVLGKRSLESGDIVEAAAWDMMARRIGQNVNSDALGRNNPFSNMSQEQRTAAGVRVKEISAQIGVPL